MSGETVIALSIGCQSPELVTVPTSSLVDAFRCVMDYLDSRIICHVESGFDAY
ncbi:hypothetical protein [Methanospirillum sp.]